MLDTLLEIILDIWYWWERPSKVGDGRRSRRRKNRNQVKIVRRD